MATPNSEIKLYHVDFNKDMNCVVDNLTTYLQSSVMHTFNDVMYQKIELDMEVKLPLPQSKVVNPLFNYVSIKNSDNNRVFYFFIRDLMWLSNSGVKLALSMDTLNTFKSLLVFTNNTKITRQHKDRFLPAYYSSGATTVVRKIDRPSEITGLTKYKTNIAKINDSNYQKWYLVYANDNDDDNAPISCYLVPAVNTAFVGASSEYSYTTFLTGTVGDLYTIHEVSRVLTLTLTDNSVVTVNCNSSQTWYIRTVASQYSYVEVGGKGPDTTVYNVTKIGFSGITHLTLYSPGFAVSNLSNAQFLSLAHNGQTTITLNASGTFTLNNITRIHRTASKLVKIIECPYPPIGLQMGSGGYLVPNGTSVVFLKLTTDADDYGGFFLKVDDLSTEFETTIGENLFDAYQCTIPPVAARTSTNKNPLYESKLYHSDFHSEIYDYDSFTKEFKMENLIPSGLNVPKLTVKYKQANTITSNLGFKFIPTYGAMSSTDRYEEYLICKRNNEYPIFNSSYLNYLRNGYNYDVKAKNLNTLQGVTSTAISLLGGIAGIAFGGVVGKAAGISLLTSTIASLTSTMYSGIQADANIEQKVQEARNTANNVASSDDLNLLNWYNENKLYKCQYDISSQMRSNVFDLFYKTGYICSESGVPNTTSRYRFNFLQCTPDFATKANDAWQEYLPDIIARFELGVTYFHTFDDFNQQKENWEVWLMS